jgi:hypothetical protein
VVDELLELLQRVQLVLLVPEVQFLQVLTNLLPVVQEAHLHEVEQEEEVELLALPEAGPVLVVDLHQAGDVAQ